MNRKAMKLSYSAPVVKFIQFTQPLSLLVSVSVQAGIEDWEEGDEL